MNKYHNGKIYKIVDVGYNKCYIGSTTESLSRRMAHHKCSFKYYQQGLINKVCSFDLFDEYGVENCKIELVEFYPTNTKEELLKREGEHIKNNECVNKYVSGRTIKQWLEDHKEECKKKQEEYKQRNNEQIRLWKKQYREDHREEIN